MAKCERIRRPDGRARLEATINGWKWKFTRVCVDHVHALRSFCLCDARWSVLRGEKAHSKSGRDQRTHATVVDRVHHRPAATARCSEARGYGRPRTTEDAVQGPSPSRHPAAPPHSPFPLSVRTKATERAHLNPGPRVRDPALPVFVRQTGVVGNPRRRRQPKAATHLFLLHRPSERHPCLCCAPRKLREISVGSAPAPRHGGSKGYVWCMVDAGFLCYVPRLRFLPVLVLRRNSGSRKCGNLGL